MNGKRLASLPISAYQAWRLPRPPSCRYVPTCSTYALEAIELHGAFKGMLLAMRRILRCAPWGGWGSDPVPEPNARRA